MIGLLRGEKRALLELHEQCQDIKSSYFTLHVVDSGKGHYITDNKNKNKNNIIINIIKNSKQQQWQQPSNNNKTIIANNKITAQTPPPKKKICRQLCIQAQILPIHFCPSGQFFKSKNTIDYLNKRLIHLVHHHCLICVLHKQNLTSAKVNLQAADSWVTNLSL